MKILYIGKHNSGDNDDEGGITHALRVLGHVVTPMQQHAASLHVRSLPGRADVRSHDLVLFNKWDDYEGLEQIRNLGVPAVFWYFDLVRSDDWELKGRNKVREEWARKVIPLCRVGFFTDGDFVRAYNTEWCDVKCVGENPKGHGGIGPLHWLMQGADERVIGPGVYREELACDILFTGTVIHGGRRASHVQELKDRYGSRFVHVGEKGPDRVHGRRLADLYASAKVVIAPEAPVTDRYWSNRVYLTLGFGGFLLHPYCEGLIKHYRGSELIMYASRDDLHDLIGYYTGSLDLSRAHVMKNGLERTRAEHLYRHRCTELIKVVEGLL